MPVIQKDMKGDTTIITMAFEQVGDEGYYYCGNKYTDWRWTSNSDD